MKFKLLKIESVVEFSIILTEMSYFYYHKQLIHLRQLYLRLREIFDEKVIKLATSTGEILPIRVKIEIIAELKF